MPIKIESHPSATGIFTVTNPNSSTSTNITLPDANTTLVGTDVTQTLTNKTISNCDIQGGALTRLASVNASGLSIDFTSIPSWVKRITLTVSSISISGSNNLQIQLGTSSGLVTTGYLGALGGVNYTTGFGLGSSFAASTVAHAITSIVSIGNNVWVSSTVGGFSSSTGSISGGGSVTMPGDVDRLRITTTAGVSVFDAGVVNIMYEG